MNHAGEISTLVAIAEPDVRVWTNVGEAHLGFFASLDAIADAKAEILEGAGPDRRCSWRMPTTTAIAARAREVPRDAWSRLGSIATPTSAPRAVADRGVDGVAAHITTPRGSVDVVTPL